MLAGTAVISGVVGHSIRRGTVIPHGEKVFPSSGFLKTQDQQKHGNPGEGRREFQIASTRIFGLWCRVRPGLPPPFLAIVGESVPASSCHSFKKYRV